MKTLLQNVTIAIVTKNRRTALIRLLDSLAQQTHIHEVKKISIFENQVASLSSADKVFVKKKLKNIYFNFSPLRKVESRNLALRFCRTKYLIFLDDDVTVSEKWLQVLSQIVKKKKNGRERAVVYQGSYKEAYQNQVCVRVLEMIREYKFNSYNIENSELFLDPLSLDTNNVLLDVDFLRKHHLHFDSIYNKYGFAEDTDLGYRIHQLGGTMIYKPALCVTHHKSINFWFLIYLGKLSGASYGIFSKKNHIIFAPYWDIVWTSKILKYIYHKGARKLIQSLCVAAIYRCVFIWYFSVTFLFER